MTFSVVMMIKAMLVASGLLSSCCAQPVVATGELAAMTDRKHLRALQESAPASAHTGAYTGALLHDTGPTIQTTKLRANWVPAKDEILQVCGIKSSGGSNDTTGNPSGAGTYCQQIKLSYVEKSEEDMKITEKKSSDGEEIFRIKYWPPFHDMAPGGSAVNKAGTDAIILNPAWSTSNCTVMDVSLVNKFIASPNQTKSCRDMVMQPQALFEFFKMPKFVGHGAAAMSIIGVFAVLAVSVTFVAVKRSMRSYQQIPHESFLEEEASHDQIGS